MPGLRIANGMADPTPDMTLRAIRRARTEPYGLRGYDDWTSPPAPSLPVNPSEVEGSPSMRSIDMVRPARVVTR